MGVVSTEETRVLLWISSKKLIDFYSRKTSRPLGFEALSELSACGVVSLGKKKGQSHRQSSEIEVDMAILVPSQFLK